MTGRSLEPWRSPALLSEWPIAKITRRGSQQDVLAALRRLQGGAGQRQPITPAPEGQPLPHALWRRLVAVVTGRQA